MRTTRTLLCCTLLLPGLLHAQAVLINGGFEDDQGGSLEGWDWLCDTPLLVSDVAPDGGSWAAAIKASNDPACPLNRLIQRLPEAAEGDLLTLSGWAHIIHGVPITGAFLGLGAVSNGDITPLQEVGTMDYPFSYLTVTWTVTLAAGDTAAVILSPGELPPTGIYSFAGFDGLVLNKQVGLEEVERPSLTLYQHGDRLYFATTDGQAILEAHLLDAQGRTVQRIPPGRATMELPMDNLSSGLYVLVARGAYGTISRKFVRD